MKTVYIDELFAINLAVNYFILLAAARFSGIEARRLRLLIASAFGAAYAAAMFFPEIGFLYTAALKAVFTVLIVLIAFGKKTKGKLFRVTAVFFMVSLAFAGMVMASRSLFSKAAEAIDMRNGVFYINISLKTLIISIAAAYALIAVAFRGNGRRHVTEKRFYQVAIFAFGKKTLIEAMEDTGNDLVDPISGKKIIAVELSSVLPLLNGETYRAVSRLQYESAPEVIERLSETEDGTRFRLTPYRAVGVASGMLLTMRPDKVEIDGKEADILVAIVPGRLSEAGGYTALCGI